MRRKEGLINQTFLRACLTIILIGMLLPMRAPAQEIEIFTDRGEILPEDDKANVFIRASGFSGSISEIKIGFADRSGGLIQIEDHAGPFSNNVFTLTSSQSSGSFTVLAAPNDDAEPDLKAAAIGFSSVAPQNTSVFLWRGRSRDRITGLEFLIPPNDLTVRPGTMTASVRVTKESSVVKSVKGRFTIEEGLSGSKFFAVSFPDTRVTVQDGFIIQAQGGDSFPVTLNVKDPTFMFGDIEDGIDLTVSHLDYIQSFPDQDLAMVSSGDSHTCAVRVDGTLVCWGSDGGGRSSLIDRHSADQGGPIDADDQFLSVSAGGTFTCAVRIDGRLACWGLDVGGRVSPIDDHVAEQGGPINAGDRFLSVSSGSDHSCAVRIDGRLACWGHDGDERASPIGDYPTDQGGPINAGDRFLSVSAGFAHACAVRIDGRLACWGRNGGGEALPIGMHDARQGGPIAESDRFLSVSAGREFNCAVRVDETLVCWGIDTSGRIFPISSHSPDQGGPIDADDRFLSVSAGNFHVCAVRINGRLVCWGNNAGGRSLPIGSHSAEQGGSIAADDQFLSVDAGTAQACAVRINGTLACWGSPDRSQALEPLTRNNVPANQGGPITAGDRFLAGYRLEREQKFDGQGERMKVAVELQADIRLRIRVYLEGALRRR